MALDSNQTPEGAIRLAGDPKSYRVHHPMAAGEGIEPSSFRRRSFQDCLVTLTATRQTRVFDPLCSRGRATGRGQVVSHNGLMRLDAKSVKSYPPRSLGM